MLDRHGGVWEPIPSCGVGADAAALAPGREHPDGEGVGFVSHPELVRQWSGRLGVIGGLEYVFTTVLMSSSRT